MPVLRYAGNPLSKVTEGASKEGCTLTINSILQHGQEPPDLAKLLWYSCGVAAVLLQVRLEGQTF